MSKPVTPDSQKYRLDLKRPTLLTLILLISYGTLGAAIFTPAIPAVMDRFNVGASLSQLTVMFFLIGYSFGQLIYSPIAKRFGRKPAFYTGISISLFGSLLCILSGFLDHFSLLLTGRFISALGSSVGLSLTFTIISDHYYESHARKVTAYTMLAFAVIPGIAIALGGILIDFFGWESCFYFLTAYGVFALYIVYGLAETSSGKEFEATKWKAIFSAYKRDFKNSLLILYSLMIGATTSLVYVFAASVPVIVIRGMEISPARFGLLNLIPALGYFLGNFVAARLANHFKVKTVLKGGLALIGLGILFMAILLFGGWGNALNIFFPAFVIYLGIPLFYSNAAVIATFRVPDKPNASSIMSFINIGGAVIGLILIELVHFKLIYAMPAVFLIAYGTILLLFRQGQALIEE